MGVTAESFTRSSNRLYVGSDGDYITSYDRLDANHKLGFVANLVEQARSHGHAEVNKEHANVVANMIGREFDVVLLCGPKGEKDNYVKGMIVTSRADTAEGTKVLVEDIVVDSEMRRKGFASALMRYCAIEAWDAGMAGVTLEVGRQNEAAKKMYEKLGASVAANPQIANWNNFHDVWHVPADKVRSLATAAASGESYAELATPDNLEPIVRVLSEQPNRDSGSLSQILSRQKSVVLSRQAHVMESVSADKDRSFIVSLADGSFAITTETFSTFVGGMRADARLYLSNNGDRRKAAKLIRGVATEIGKRSGWGGAVSIEFCDNVMGLTGDKLGQQRSKIMTSQVALNGIGCVPLEHNGSKMVPFELSGERFLNVVEEAVRAFPDRPLTNGALKRFHEGIGRRQQGMHAVVA